MNRGIQSCLQAVLVSTLVLIGMVASAPAWAGHITLNDTGVTRCLDVQGHWASHCANSRQDAGFGRDVDDANPNDGVLGFSFRKICRSGQMAGEGSCPADPVLGYGPDNWGCVYDTVSGLTWESKTKEDGLHYYRQMYTNKGQWARADPDDAAWLVDATNTEALCGATNWRLPHILELQSIVHYGQQDPDGMGPRSIDLAYFPNTQAYLHWTRDESVEDSKAAWYVEFQYGQIDRENRTYINAGAIARLVHGAARNLPIDRTEADKDRFIPSADGTEVTDTLTGLIWRRCAEGMAWNSSTKTCDGSPAEYGWTEAFEHAKAERFGGWRIPNVKELSSILDHRVVNPALDQVAFPNAAMHTYLTSSPLDTGDKNAWAYWVETYRGAVHFYLVVEQNHFMNLRLVRRGRE